MTSNTGVAISKNVVLIIVTTVSFIMPFLVASVSVALPTMGREFNMDAVMISWVSTVYFLTTAMIQVPCGRLADIYGRKKLLLLGLVISVFSSFLVAYANTVPMLIISRALQGVGAGVTLNQGIAILTTVIPANERGQALGISMAGTYSGLSLGPFIGGVLTEQFGWESIFYLSGILSIVLIVLVFWALKGEWAEARGEKFDKVGSVTFAIAIALFVYGFSTLNTVLGGILLVIGILGLLLFARWEARTESPVYNLALFRKNRVFIFSNLAALITYIAGFAQGFLMSLYLQYIHGQSPQTAGLVLVSPAVVMTIFTPISGRISDRIEPRLVASVGITLLCISLFMFIFLHSNSTLGFVIAGLAIYGTGMGFFSSPNSNAIMGSVEKRVLGVASGTLGTTRTGGMLLSMGIIMVLFSIYMGQAEITPDLYPEFLTSMRAGFIIFTIICLVGIIVQFAARRAKQA